MKIQLIHLFTAASLFILVLSWSHWTTTKTKWVESNRRVKDCRRFTGEISHLRSEIEGKFKSADSQFRSPECFNRVFASIGVARNRNIRETVDQSMDSLGIDRIGINNPFPVAVTIGQVLASIQDLQNGPDPIFAESIRLTHQGNPKEGEPEKWNVQGKWYYFRNRK